ncbi:endonuclease/exonuclease/phosphatase family metal-dependent hydrolase [Salinibacter ruber]|nr:endonuclease/exonuclease/phosphatase family protein [Salinibacter ruber]MBB4061891.1 endonuclease/exonuclease/phosphatase family metal-dependent hydrolase [Salinibacter ruber]MCS3936825.1 endonuclease/exonuclease/phosphatase family metal-dependent hydrolase [Salinibacter ruber]MCS4047158.1 endonuclease/exonuclease/phosphatase family metal-dependent hydrolase [Salinibacter ruber]MCS4172664.1 endonuclease/exonuclease/phosphatase family metal-dependent hydrolase [Salinibacter ruber]
MPKKVWVLFLLCVGLVLGCRSREQAMNGEGTSVRAMTYNIEDVRTADLRRTDHPRLQRAAARIQHLAPDVLLVNEMTYDQPGDPGYRAGDPEGQNAQRFVHHYLSTPQADSLDGLSYRTVMLPVNTGLHSGLDLNNDGQVAPAVPEIPGAPEDGSVPPQTDAGRTYGNDAWGFGTFPGQYGMALLVRDDLTVLRDSIRTFRLLPWHEKPNASVPLDTTSFEPWYSPAEWAAVRLSSKSHWDVPVRLPNGEVLHVLASHPTPPGFDGVARRNNHRNHDEVQFWSDYLNQAAYVEDDSGRGGGLHDDAPFLVMGDLNADPDDASIFRNAIRHLIGHERVDGGVVPEASPARQADYPDLDPDDTSRWGARIDYVLPAATVAVDDAGVWRPAPARVPDVPVSDHFPVWVDVRVGP